MAGGNSVSNLISSGGKSGASDSPGTGVGGLIDTHGHAVAQQRTAHGGGGFFGDIGNFLSHDIAHPLGTAATDFGNFFGGASAAAQRDVAGIAGGAWDLARTIPQADIHDFVSMASHGGNVPKGYKNPDWGNKQQAELDQFVESPITAPVMAAEHPLRDPALTLVALGAPFLHLGGDLGFRAAAGLDAARNGESVVGALARHPDLPLRSLRGENGEPVFLHGSHNPGMRAMQILHDRIVQKALLERPDSRLAGYGNLRMRGGLAMDRLSQRARGAISADLRSSVAQIKKEIRRDPGVQGLGLTRKNAMTAAMAALRAVSENAMPAERSLQHQEWARQDAVLGLDPTRNEDMAAYYHWAHELGLTTLDENGHSAINAERYPALAEVDRKILAGSTKVDELLRKHGFMTAEQQDRRADQPNEVYGTGAPLETQRMTPGWRAAVAQRDRLSAKLEKSLQADEAFQRGEGPKNVDGYRVPQGPHQTPGGVEVPELARAESPLRDRITRLRTAHDAADAKVHSFELRHGIIREGDGMPEGRQALYQAMQEHLGEERAQQVIQQLDERAKQYAAEISGKSSDFWDNHLREVSKTGQVVPPEALSQDAHPLLQESPELRSAAEKWAQENGQPIDKYVSEFQHGLNDAAHNPLAEEDLNAGSQRAADAASLRAGARAGEPGRAQEEEAGSAGEHPLGAAGGRRGGGGQPDTASGGLGEGDLLHQEFAEPPKSAGEVAIRTHQRQGVKILGAYEPGSATLHYTPEANAETFMHEGFHAIRQSLPAGLQEALLRHYGETEWTRQAEESFVNDMLSAQKGEHVAPLARRAYRLLTGFEKGRNYLPYRTSERGREPSAQASPAVPPVVGDVKNPVGSDFRGLGITHGRVPDNPVRDLADSWDRALKAVSTAEQRDDFVRTGSDTRRSQYDILARIRGTGAGKIPFSLEQVLGRRRSTLDSLPGDSLDHEVGALAATKAFLEDVIPSFGDHEWSDWEQQHAIGAKAPDGFKWVDRRLIGNPNRFIPANYEGLAGFLVRRVDDVNAAITAATVYFKLGHVGTRFGTNAMTNIVQGSMNPVQIGHGYSIWSQLDDTERAKAVQATGTHYYQSLPQEGQDVIGRVSRSGANWWARYADQWFRFNSLTFEARKAGFSGVDGFREFLGKLENARDLSPEEAHQIREIAERADRAAIAYDHLGEFEKRVVSRVIWFYPWLKGSAMFAKDTLFEHPFKSAALMSLGHAGAQEQQQQLGAVPTYEDGLFQVGSPDKTGMPLVSDFSTFSPFSTAADIAGLGTGKEPVSGFFNPAMSALFAAANNQTGYGTPIKNPNVGNELANFFSQMAAPTPEYQILHTATGHHGKLFPNTVMGEFMRYLLGPAYPRRINLEQAHLDAQRQGKGG